MNGTCAESWIAACDFDLGRYADILLNVFLGILIFFFPGGYNWTLFCGMFVSHIVIYLFDHWRVLNVIPTIKITSYQVDWREQAVAIDPDPGSANGPPRARIRAIPMGSIKSSEKNMSSFRSR